MRKILVPLKARRVSCWHGWAQQELWLQVIVGVVALLVIGGLFMDVVITGIVTIIGVIATATVAG